MTFAEIGRLISRRVQQGWSAPTSYLICSTPRSGSGMLAHYLWSTERAGRPDEYFQYWWFAANDPARLQADHVRPWVLERHQYMEKLRQEATTPNGVLSIKLMEDQIDVAIANLVLLYPRYQGLPDHAVFKAVFPGVRYVHLRRCDTVRQAVSWAKASLQGEWFQFDLSAEPQSRPDPEYDFNLIDHYYNDLLRQERRWEAFFTAAKVQPYRVEYEALSRDPTRVARDLLRWVGIPHPWRPVTFHRRKTRAPQSSSLDEEWARRYVDDCARQGRDLSAGAGEGEQDVAGHSAGPAVP